MPDPRAELIERGRAVHRVIGRYLNAPSYEEFELSHLRKGDEDGALRYWETVAAAYASFARRHLLTELEEQIAFHDIRRLALDEVRTMAEGYAYWDELAADVRQADLRNLQPTLGIETPIRP